jgi:hypothetical protein
MASDLNGAIDGEYTILDSSIAEDDYQDKYNCVKSYNNKSIIDGVNIIINKNLKCN